jgi:uncharacterized protein YegP (UPF0339 family)
MAAKYDVRTSSDGQYYFNLKAANGKVILTSERYTTKANASNRIRSVRHHCHPVRSTHFQSLRAVLRAQGTQR